MSLHKHQTVGDNLLHNHITVALLILSKHAPLRYGNVQILQWVYLSCQNTHLLVVETYKYCSGYSSSTLNNSPPSYETVHIL